MGHHLLTYLLTPWSRVLIEKLASLQLVKKFPAFYGTRRFLTALTSAHHLSLSWASPIQSSYTNPTSWRSILILSSHLRLGLPSGLFPSGFPTSTLYTPLPSPMGHNTRHYYRTNLSLYKYWKRNVNIMQYIRFAVIIMILITFTLGLRSYGLLYGVCWYFLLTRLYSLSVPFSRVRQNNGQAVQLPVWPLTVGPRGCSEMSVNNVPYLGWRERNQQDATNLIFIIKLLSQHVSGIIMPIIRRTIVCTAAYGVVHWLWWLWLCGLVVEQ